MSDNIISWLLEGDVSIRYQTRRDLLSEENLELRSRIVTEGWGRKFLSLQNDDGSWGKGFYQPKWTSTHYTLLDIKNLNIFPDCLCAKKAVVNILRNEKGADGGVNPSGSIVQSDVCINGIFLNYASYFQADELLLNSIVDFLLSQIMSDGGFNCRYNRSGAKHSSLHTTLSVLEGILEYKRNGYGYRLTELLEAEKSSIEFMLQHRLFRSDKTGAIIDKKFLKFSFPYRWRYDILRALDYFRDAGVSYDERMSDALSIIEDKRTKSGLWKTPAHQPGAVHFAMEQAGKPGRWNTLRALRVLKYFNIYR